MAEREFRTDPNAERRRLHERIDNDFVYHAPADAATVEKYAEIRHRFRDLAHHLVHVCPIGRELSLSITKLEEATFWANAGIARSNASED